MQQDGLRFETAVSEDGRDIILRLIRRDSGEVAMKYDMAHEVAAQLRDALAARLGEVRA